MADASPAPAGVDAATGDEFAPHDRFVRLFQAAPVAPAWVGLALVGAYMGLYFLVMALGGGGVRQPDMLVWEALTALIAAYVLTANVYAVRWARRDLNELRPHLDLSDRGFWRLLDGTTNTTGRALLLGGLLGAAGGAAVPILDPAVWGGDPRPPVTSAVFLWALFRNSLVGWCGVRAGVAEIAATRGYARAAEKVEIDLLDSARLAAFARKSQRSLVSWVGFSMLFSLFFLGNPASANVFFLLLILLVLAAVFLIPLRAVRRRIRAVKAAELEAVNTRIHRAVVREGPDAGSGPRLVDWIAYRGLVESVPEWPINAPALLRSLLFAVLGLASWLGGAVVERLLGAVLD